MLFLHDYVIREFGGAQGIRDEGLLDSALARPVDKLGYGGAEVDLFDLAAAYAYGLAKNHAFFDGNKQTAWACCVLFLKVNGQAVAAPAQAVITAMLALVQDEGDESAFAAWLRLGRSLTQIRNIATKG